MRSLNIAATGAQSQEDSVQTIANNIANVNTTSFKKRINQTTDLLYQTERRAGGAVAGAGAAVVPTSIQYGAGAATAAVITDQKQGTAINTGEPLNMAIEGQGFFVLNMPDGSQAFTRDGTFSIEPNTNQIVNSAGYVLSPGIEIPIDYKKILIKNDGTVLVELPNNDTPQLQGQIDLAFFINPNGLELKGDNILLQTDASGQAQFGLAGQDNFGSVKSGWLEGSNVEPVVEMTSLIQAQRAYEMNVKVMTTADKMTEKVTNA